MSFYLLYFIKAFSWMLYIKKSFFQLKVVFLQLLHVKMLNTCLNKLKYRRNNCVVHINCSFAVNLV